MYFSTFILKNLFRRPVRTALTVLGLAVAIGSMVALLGISHNVNQAVEDLFSKRGVDLMVTAAGKTDPLASDMRESILEVVEKVPGVAAVAPGLVDMVEVTRPSGSSINTIINGWNTEGFSFDTLTILSGRKLQNGDDHKLMLGETFANNLGKGVGETVTIQGEDFEVVGVFRSFSVFENGSGVMLLPESQRLMGRKGRITGFSVRIEPGVDVETVKQRLEELRDPKDTTLRLAAQTTLEFVNNQTHLKLVRAMSWMVSIVALAIGVISMLNTMIMSVLERTHEIGILRAVGWPRLRVVSMVLGEAVILGLAAAAVGSFGADAMTHLLSQFPRVNGFIEGGIAPVVMVEGLVLAGVIAFVGGAYPAIRAARLLPTEAIRHE